VINAAKWRQTPHDIDRFTCNSPFDEGKSIKRDLGFENGIIESSNYDPKKLKQRINIWLVVLVERVARVELDAVQKVDVGVHQLARLCTHTIG
jgi:hypothetical protein